MFLVVQTAFLGDMILTTPLLTRLAERGAVDVVATPANAGLLANHPAVRDVIVYDKRGAHRGVAGLRTIARAIRTRTVDGVSVPRGSRVAYMAQGSLRSAALVRLARVPEVIGFDRSAGRLLYTRRVAYRTDAHHATRLLMLAGMTAPSDDIARPSLFPGPGDRDAAAELLDGAGVSDTTPLVVLAPGSVWTTKRWPGYPALAARLASVAPDARVVIIGAAADAALAAEIIAAAHAAGAPAPLDATGRLSLLGTAALIARARVVVTNDSAPLHLASAMNTPTVALFGPTVPAFGFGPLATAHAVVQHDTLPCRPCDAHGPMRCPLGHWRCMQELTPERVATAAMQVADPTPDPGARLS